jgi:hypothetical protein
VGPGSGEKLKSSAPAVADFLKAGGRVAAIGLGQSDVDAFLPVKVVMKKGEHINAVFERPGMQSPLAGIGAADVYNRAPRETPLLDDGASRVGDGVLGFARTGVGDGGVVFDQMVPWQFEYQKNYGLKRTYRRASFALTRILANLGVAGRTSLLERVYAPVGAAGEKRWLEGFYLDAPEEWDDPYRFFRW